MRYNEDEARQAIEDALHEFYGRRIEKLNSLDLFNVLRGKNPYLYQVYGYQTAQEVVTSVLSAFMSSSEETIFGQIFFEKLAVAVSGGFKSSADSIDIEIRESSNVKLFAVKSGPHVFNSQSKRRQEQAFQEAINRFKGQDYTIDPIIGYAYGKKASRTARAKNYREIAGKHFWAELTGDDNFYLRIVDYIGEKPQRYIERYNEAYTHAVNRMCKSLLQRYCNSEGKLDWHSLVDDISG